MTESALHTPAGLERAPRARFWHDLSFWGLLPSRLLMGFALILPIMLTLYFGCVEVGDAVIINRKVTHVTSTLGDLVTQSRTITNADMKNILDAAASVITPYNASLVTIVLTGVTTDANGKSTVAWSDARNATALKVGATVTLPANVKVNGGFVISSTVTYKYTPVIGYMVTGPITLHDQQR